MLKNPLFWVVVVIGSNISLMIGMNYKTPSVDVCRGVVLRDIKESREYQSTVEDAVRPDYIDELKNFKSGKGTPP